MKIACLYTGALRTIRDTLSHFQKNVLQAATAAGHTIDVFAVLQSNDPAHYREPNWSDTQFPPTIPNHPMQNVQTVEIWLTEQLTPHLQNLTWFRPNNPLWVRLREYLLNNMCLVPEVADYLRTSGSMIEYYQMQMAYMEMLKYERRHNITYDYVIRLRPDVVIAQPLTFDWLQWSVEDIEKRFLDIQKVTQSSEVYCQGNFVRFMNTVYRSTVDCLLDAEMEADPPQNIFQPAVPAQIQTYLQHGRYILTLRKNVVYMLPRKCMALIACLGSTFGMYHNPNHSEWWWNAESQLRFVCQDHGIQTFDSGTALEVESLYNYDANNYYNPVLHTLCEDNPRVFFFIKRL